MASARAWLRRAGAACCPAAVRRAASASHPRLSSPARAQRLRLPREFARVLSAGKRFRGAVCTIVVLPDPEPPARLGLAISRKAAARAVRRNRIKRLVRESFRAAAPARGWCVVLARPGAGSVDDRLIKEDLTRLWTQLRKAFPQCSSASSGSTSG